MEEFKPDAKTVEQNTDAASINIDSVHKDSCSTTPISNRDKRLIPVSELLTDKVEEQGFLWEKLIPESSIALLSGPSDSGKSMLARQICVAIAKGDTDLLSLGLKTKCQTAIYVSTEDSRKDWAYKFSKMNLTEEEIKKVGNNMLIVTEYDGLLQLLDNELQHRPVDLVVIDVLPDIFSGDINSTSTIRAFLKPYKKITEKYGCSILFVHHLSKRGESNGSPNKQNILGAMGIESSMRSVLELRKDSSDGMVKSISITKGNYVSEAEKKKVYRIKQGDNFMYELLTQEQTSLQESKKQIEAEIDKFLTSGMSIRAITAELVNAGHKIGKTTVAEIAKNLKQKSNQN